MKHDDLTEEIQIFAEAIGDLKARLEKREGEQDASCVALESATATLQASLSAIKSLRFHVLDNDLGKLSTRVEEQRQAIDEQIGTIVAELKKADEENAGATGREAKALRREIGALEKEVGDISDRIRRELARIEGEAKQKYEAFATLPAVAPKSFNPVGQWTPNKLGGYDRLDVVSYLGASYLSAEDGNKDKPSAKSKKWTQLVGRSVINSVPGASFGLPTSSGMVVNNSGTLLARTITGTAGNITVSNGDGVSGNPTLSLPTALTSINSITAANATDMTLTGGSNGTSLTLGQGSANSTLSFKGAFSLTSGAAASSGDGNGVFIKAQTGGASSNGGNVVIVSGANGAGGSANGHVIFSRGGNITPTAPGSVTDEIARLTGTGNLLVGGTTDISGSGGLKVFGTTATTAADTGAFQCAGGGYFAGDLMVGGGNVAIGGAVNAAYGVNIVTSTLTGADQYGVIASPVASSSATSGVGALLGKVCTAAAAFTATNGYGLQIEVPSLGAGSAVTNISGIQVRNQGATGITNAYGIDIAAQSGAATTNVGLRNAGSTLLATGITLCDGTATPAGGSTSARIIFGTTAGFGIYYGSGAPTVSAAQGSIYIRSDGSSTSTRLYVNTNGSTGWTNFTSAA